MIPKFNTIAHANNIGVVSRIRAAHKVVKADRKIIPVGIEINSVRIMNGPCNQSAIPLVNRWWAHTTKLSATIAKIVLTTHLYANNGFLAKVEIISRSIPNAGRTIMYTAGCE